MEFIIFDIKMILLYTRFIEKMDYSPLLISIKISFLATVIALILGIISAYRGYKDYKIKTAQESNDNCAVSFIRNF